MEQWIALKSAAADLLSRTHPPPHFLWGREVPLDELGFEWHMPDGLVAIEIWPPDEEEHGRICISRHAHGTGYSNEYCVPSDISEKLNTIVLPWLESQRIYHPPSVAL